jgi:transposase-like protein
MNQPKSKFGRRYDEEFKRQTVVLIQTQQRSLRQLEPRVGRFGMEPVALVQAVRQPGGGLPAEVARLRRELEVVSRQRDILKKALAILGQEPGSATR